MIHFIFTVSLLSFRLRDTLQGYLPVLFETEILRFRVLQGTTDRLLIEQHSLANRTCGVF